MIKTDTKTKVADGGLDPDFSVREMLSDEEKEVRELFKRSLGLIDRLFFLLA